MSTAIKAAARTCCLVSDEGRIVGYADWLADNYGGMTPPFVAVGRRTFKRSVQSYNRCAVYREVKPIFAGRAVSLCGFREAL